MHPSNSLNCLFLKWKTGIWHPYDPDPTRTSVELYNQLSIICRNFVLPRWLLVKFTNCLFFNDEEKRKEPKRKAKEMHNVYRTLPIREIPNQPGCTTVVNRTLIMTKFFTSKKGQVNNNCNGRACMEASRHVDVAKPTPTCGIFMYGLFGRRV